jgi:LDH2 family malate/lactate/ureidoglycolate dehydrogenase
LVIISDKELKKIGIKIFNAVGISKKEADWVSDCLVQSNLKGVDSHSVRLIPRYVKEVQEGKIKVGTKIKLINEMVSTTFIDGCGGFGYTISKDAMKVTIEKARRFGIAYTGIRNINHIGRVGKWVEMALEENMIGIATQPGGIYIAPWGGVERKLPIAPLAISIPTGNYPPIIIDMSLGPISGGRLSILAQQGKRLPSRWIIDEEGIPTDDPNIFLNGKGAQLPLGQNGLGYKGMALSLIIDIVTGPLLGFLSKEANSLRRRGVIFGAINIEAFTPLEVFKELVDDLIMHVKESKLAPNFSEILMPGELEWREYKKRIREGIFIDEEIWNKILETARSLDVDIPSYVK